MAKKRNGISKALRKGQVESSFKIDESADDSGFGTPKTKEKSVSQAAQEQNDFNDRNRYIDERTYKSTSDPDPLGRDNAESLEPGFGQKKIADKDNFTSSSARKMDPVYNYGMGLGQNKVAARKGLGDTLYANKNQPTLDNPNATGLDEKMQPMPTLDAGNVSQTQGQSLVTAIKPSPEAKVQAQMQNDNTGTVLNNAILNNGTQAAETSTEVFEAPKVAKEAEKEADKIKSALDDTTAQVMMGAYGSFDEEGDETSMGTGEVKGDATTTTEVQTAAIPGDGTTVSNVVSTTDPTRPSFDQTATKDQVMNDIAGMYIKGQENVPYAVVEKLGVQDYYPNVGRDIAVGTFSGSRIGSQTIYSGAGALLPMGLYDARKRALKDAAKSKQAELDKILTVPDTTPQLKEAFSAYALKKKYEDLARNNFDPALYSRDLEARKNDIVLEATAKNLTYATQMAQKQLDATMPKDGKPGNYMPEEQKKILRELLTGTMEDPDAFFSGKKNVNDYHRNVKQYSDGTVWVDGMVKQWTEHPVEVPVNLKTGVALTEENVAEINAATNQYLKSVQDGSADTDSYMTMIKKYYDIDDKVVDNWANAQGYDKNDPMRATLKDYLKNQVPAASFVQSVKTNANQNVARARLALDREKFAFEKEQQESFWGVIDQGMNNAVNKQTGKTFEQELASLNKQNLSKVDLDNALKKLYNVYSVATESTVVKNNKGNWVVQIPSTSTQAEQIQTRDVYGPNGKLLRGLNVQVYNKDTKTWESREMAPREIAKYKGNSSKIRINGKTVTDDQFDGFSASASGMYTKVIGHEITKGYVNKQGAFVPLTSDNLAEYEANPKVTLQRPIEQPYAKVERDKVAPGQTSITEIILPGQTRGEWINISDRGGRMHSDQQSGFTTRQSAQAQGEGNVSASGSTSGSASSFAGF